MKRLSKPSQKVRRGITLAEMFVACAVTVTLMGMITTLCLRIQLVYRDIGHQRLALNELANQMDELTRLSENDLEEKLGALVVSDELKGSLREPVLTGQVQSSKLGTKLLLQLDWKRKHPSKPVELVGWLTETKAVDPDSAPEESR